MLRDLRRGSSEMLEQAVEQYAPYVSAVVRNIIGSVLPEVDVEEAAAEVFVTLWQKAEEVRPGSLRPWLGGVARNKALQKLRGLGREVPLEEDLLELPAAGPETEVERRERDCAVRRAVLAMAEPDREIFLRHYYHCQPVAKIARELDMPENTVKSRLRRGREKLKNTLTKTLTTGGEDDEIPDL